MYVYCHENDRSLLAMTSRLYDLSLFFPHAATFARTVLDLFFQKLFQNESTTLLRGSSMQKMWLYKVGPWGISNRATENTSVDG